MQLYDMTVKLREWLIKCNYSPHTIKEYQNSLNRIIEFYSGFGINDYSPKVTAEFIKASSEAFERGELYKTTFRNRRKCAVLLDEYFNCGIFTWKVNQPLKSTAFQLNSYYDGLIYEFKIYWKRQGRWGDAMLKTQVSLARQFLEYLQINSIANVRNITTVTITDYMNYAKLRHPSGVTEVCAAIRFLGDFLNANQINAPDLRLIVPVTTSRTVIMPSFNDEEVFAILSSVDRTTSQGKRDYAMLILSAKLGLRAGDVARLQLSNIDWRKSDVELRFEQPKTGTEIILPIENDVGNAVADYILNARPKTDNQHIFLTARPPYRRIKAPAVSQCTRRYMDKSGLSFKRGSGSHSFRRHLATNMLNAGVPYERICEGLGHTDPSNLKSYARIDSKGLAECALRFSDICPVSGVLA